MPDRRSIIIIFGVLRIGFVSVVRDGYFTMNVH